MVAGKTRQTKRHLLARVPARERDALASWLSPAQLDLFDAMHVADRRHGLDVVAALRAAARATRRCCSPACCTMRARATPGSYRASCTHSARPGMAWAERAVAQVPGMGAALDRLHDHPEVSARMAETAGCPPRTVS